jgi:hypothetical protein
MRAEDAPLYFARLGGSENVTRYMLFAPHKSMEESVRSVQKHLSRYEAELANKERYCPNCHILVWDTRCPVCGKNWLEEPLPNDYCFLMEKDAVWAGVLEDCLRQNGIPCLTQSAKGAGLTVKTGSMFDSIRFYVPYFRFHEAQDLAEQLFAESGDQITEEDLP